MGLNAQTISRLKSQLLTSGLQQKDQPLWQVINQLIDAVSIVGQTGGGGSGIPGPIGPQGPQGANAISFMYGYDGEDGIDGQPGIVGPQGNIGNTGPQGSPGLPVSFAIDGIDGIDGFSIPGPPGLIGVKGNPGIPGIMGIWGIDGQDGYDSLIPGPRGIAGSAGANGSLLIASIDISTAQYIALNVTPLTVIAAPGSGKALVPIMLGYRATISTLFAGRTIQASWVGGGNVGTGIAGPSSVGEYFRWVTPTAYTFSASGQDNTSIQIILTGGAAGAGVITKMRFYIAYFIINLP